MIPLLLLALAADRLPAYQAQAAAVLRPGPDDQKWKRIGWRIDLASAVKTAQEEKRPLFVWVSGDPPLERC